MVKFILICATGRSGSTTLQRILNTIPDSNICGENDGAIINILKFYKNIKKTVTMRPGKQRSLTSEQCENRKIKPCWYNSFNNDIILLKIRELIIELFDNKKNNRVIGCKEIRFIHDDLSLLNEFIELFPETKIILHYKKDIDSQSKSDWFALDKDSKNLLLEHNTKMINFYNISNKDKFYLSTFEEMFDEQFMINIFNFLSEQFNKKLYLKILSNKLE
jgi:hypothetical protein